MAMTKTRTGSRIVAVNLTLEVDPVAWQITQGEFSREAVQAYVLDTVLNSPIAGRDEAILAAQAK